MKKYSNSCWAVLWDHFNRESEASQQGFFSDHSQVLRWIVEFNQGCG